MAKSSAQRQAALSERKRESNLRPFNVWLPMSIIEQLDAYASATDRTRAEAAALAFAKVARTKTR